jgi:hypothetical protein
MARSDHARSHRRPGIAILPLIGPVVGLAVLLLGCAAYQLSYHS